MCEKFGILANHAVYWAERKRQRDTYISQSGLETRLLLVLLHSLYCIKILFFSSKKNREKKASSEEKPASDSSSNTLKPEAGSTSISSADSSNSLTPNTSGTGSKKRERRRSSTTKASSGYVSSEQRKKSEESKKDSKNKIRKARSYNDLKSRGGDRVEAKNEEEQEEAEGKGEFHDLVTDLSELEIQQYQGMLLANQLQPI